MNDTARCELSPYSDFPDLLRAHLSDLQARWDMALWMLIRPNEEGWVPLGFLDRYYGLTDTESVSTLAALSARCTRGDMPVVLPDTAQTSDFADAPCKVGAFVGLPLISQGGRTLGLLCGLNPSPCDAIDGQTICLSHQARLLSYILEQELKQLNQDRIVDFMEQSHRCHETDLLNKTGWQEVLTKERRRCAHFGLQAMIVHVHGPDGANRQDIADALAARVRSHDSIAHLGQSRFAILLSECSQEKAHSVADRIRDTLNSQQLLAAVRLEMVSASNY